MVKLNLMRSSALALAMFLSAGSVDAQNKVWGVGSGVNEAEAQFSTNFAQATTTGSYSPTSWTALHVSQGSGSPGAYWTRSLLGYSQGAYAGNTPMPSPSQANGVAIFDSDFLDNNGVAGAFGTGTSPTPHRGELISPRIDLTGNTNIPLVVEFFSEYRDFQINALSVGVSVDDGVTWVDSDYRALQSGSSPGFVRVLFGSATAGVANLTQCRIRFVFDNDYYYAMVDDVSIETAPDYDIAMGLPNPSGNLLIDAGDHVKVGGNAYNSIDNIVHANDLREWFWGGKVVNYGAEDILPTANPRMYVTIDHTHPVTGAVTPNVYLDTLVLDTIAANNPGGATYIEYLDNLNFLSSNGAGRYGVRYWVAHDSMDANGTNDTVEHSFVITGTGTNEHYVSKARRANADGRVFASRGIFPGGGPFGAFEYGSVYFFPRGTADSVCLDSLEFRYRLGAGFTGAASQTLLSKIYEMDASSSAILNAQSLLTEVGVAQIAMTGLGTTVAPGDFGLQVVNQFFDPVSGGALPPFKDNGFYYISLIINPSLTGGAATFSGNDVPQIGVDEFNYYMNSAMTGVDSVINPSPLAITDNAGSTTWYWTGFGSDFVPSIGLHLNIKAHAIPLSTTTVWEEEGADMNVYPNPTSDLLNVDFSLEDAADVTYILTDMSGRVISVVNSANVTKETQTIDVSQLPAGMYMITAKTDTKSATEKFIVK